MTARQVFEATLIELSKIQAPSLKLYEFNYLFNKAINQYINKVYNVYDINQQTTDDLRVLKSTAYLVPQKMQLAAGNSAIRNIELNRQKILQDNDAVPEAYGKMKYFEEKLPEIREKLKGVAPFTMDENNLNGINVYFYNGIIKTTNINEKAHLIISMIDNLCHEIVYHKHQDMDYKKMQEIVIDSILNMLK